jgi:hypothetical protein
VEDSYGLFNFELDYFGEETDERAEQLDVIGNKIAEFLNKEIHPL